MEKEVEIYTPAEVDALLLALDPWWRLLAMFASETGLRWGELMGLKVSDFGLNFRTGNGTRFMWKDYPKGKKPRRMGITIQAATAVWGFVAERGLGLDDRLFSMPDKTAPPEWHPPLTLEWTPEVSDVWPGGVPVSRSHFRDVLGEAIVKARLSKQKFHDLRASHISWLLAGGADMPTVSARGTSSSPPPAGTSPSWRAPTTGPSTHSTTSVPSSPREP